MITRYKIIINKSFLISLERYKKIMNRNNMGKRTANADLFSYLYDNKRVDIHLLNYVRNYFEISCKHARYSFYHVYNNLSRMGRKKTKDVNRMWDIYYISRCNMYDRIKKDPHLFDFTCSHLMISHVEGAFSSVNFRLLSFLKKKSDPYYFKDALEKFYPRSSAINSHNLLLIKFVYGNRLKNIKPHGGDTYNYMSSFPKYIFKQAFENEYIRDAWSLGRIRVILK